MHLLSSSHLLLSINNAANLSLVKDAKKELRKTYEKEQSAYLQTKIDEIKSAADNKQSALAWNTVNEISGRKRSYKAKLKASDQEDRLHKWKEHFQNLLGKAPNVLDRPDRQYLRQKWTSRKEISQWKN